MPSDQELMLSVGRGNLDDFEEIVRRHQRMAWGVAYRFLNDAREAEDVVQDAFLKILAAAPRYRPSASFKTYLYKVVANLCLDFKRKILPIRTASLPDPGGAGPGAAELLLSREQARLVQQALSSLPPQQRLAVILRYYEEMSYQEIAQAMQISEKAVERLLARGRELLKKLLAE